ncbi:MAG TPA: hypothetical protein PLC65_15890, partial [Bacteroidia bacterium]|nr:hypothetical protein [Bacteroidia bacterium]
FLFCIKAEKKGDNHLMAAKKKNHFTCALQSCAPFVPDSDSPNLAHCSVASACDKCVSSLKVV